MIFTRWVEFSNELRGKKVTRTQKIEIIRSCQDIGGASVKKSIKLSFFNGSILADRVIKLSSYFLNKNDSAIRNEVKLFSEFL